MVEAGCWRPPWQSFAAEVAEAFLEAGEVGSGLRVAGRDWAAGARVAALEIYFADAEADYAALVFTIKLIFPEGGEVPVCAGGFRGVLRAGRVCVRRVIIDFERGAKALARIIKRHAREPLAYTLQRCGGNNCWTVGDVVVGKAFRRVAHQNLLLEVDAEPFRGVFGAAGEGKRSRGNIAAIAGNRERHCAEIRRVASANQV